MPTVREPLMGWNVFTVRHNITQLSWQQGGEIWWRGLKTIKDTTVCGTVESFTTGKSIHHSVHLIGKLNVTGSHAVVVFLSTIKINFAWDAKHSLGGMYLVYHQSDDADDDIQWDVSQCKPTAVTPPPHTHAQEWYTSRQGRGRKSCYADGGLCEFYPPTTDLFLSVSNSPDISWYPFYFADTVPMQHLLNLSLLVIIQQCHCLCIAKQR